MLFVREARLSVWKTLKDRFESVSNWNPAFNIYGIEDIKTAESSLTRPYIFILDSYVVPTVKHLPVIVIDCDTGIDVIGLAEKASYCDVELNIIGRSRGERDDIAGDIMENVTAISIYDFDPTTPVLVETQNLIAVNGSRIWDYTLPDISTSMLIEESLRNWAVLHSRFLMNN